jgi:integrase
VNVTHGLKRRLTDAGLPATLRFHDLRHSTASLLLTQGVAPRVVADVLGHTDVRTTLNTYTHVADSVRQDAVAKLGALFQTA